MKNNFKMPYVLDGSTLINIYLSNELIYLRVALQNWAIDIIDKDEKKTQIVDIICKGIKIKNFEFPEADFCFAGGEVIAFIINDHNVYFQVDDFVLNFSFDELETKSLMYFDLDKIPDYKPEEIAKLDFYKLPISNFKK